MNIGIIIQARMGSTRLPGKILKPFYDGKTLLEVLLESLHKIDGVKIVVATSVNAGDDALEAFLADKGELCFRGSEADVLQRFVGAAEKYGIDGIVRICSDNPFLDRKAIVSLVNYARKSDADYIGYRINDTPSILTHFGFWAEFVRLSALKKVYEATPAGSPAHEHVTYHVYHHPDLFKCEWLEADTFLEGRNDIRLTVDTPEDFENARKVYADLRSVNEDFSLRDVVEYLDENKEIRDSMLTNIGLNAKK